MLCGVAGLGLGVVDVALQYATPGRPAACCPWLNDVRAGYEGATGPDWAML
jgi:hypothetical protein